MTDKIAVDIVLLLPNEVVSICRELNSKTETSDYVSFGEGYVPHITLAMTCILRSELEDLKLKIGSILKNYQPLDLTIKGFNQDYPNWLEISIDKESSLMRLHEDLIQLLEGFSPQIATKDDFLTTEISEVSDKLVDKWMNGFKKNLSGQNYNPHISIGKGVALSLKNSINFTSKEVGLFWVGKHGTCKEELARFKLYEISGKVGV